MKAVYKPGVRYVCDALERRFDEAMCASLDGPSIETVVARAFFTAIQPAELDALEALIAQRREERAKVDRNWQEQLQRATYEANLARRRYEAVDPDNRLVAAELERRWEEQLVTVRQLQEGVERFRSEPALMPLAPEVRDQFEHIAQSLPDLWENGQLTNEHKKMLLRSLISRVILKRIAPDRVEVKIVWASGHFSIDYLAPPIHRQVDVSRYDEMVARIHSLWKGGKTDDEIAETLTREGFHSARSSNVTAQIVLKIRHQHIWMSNLHRHRRADKLDGLWTIKGLAKELGVHRNWLYKRIHTGALREPDVICQPPYGNYLIADNPVLIGQLSHEVEVTHHGRGKAQS